MLGMLRVGGLRVTIVASPTEDGEAHGSAGHAVDYYWVEKYAGGLLKLHMREHKNETAGYPFVLCRVLTGIGSSDWTRTIPAGMGTWNARNARIPE